jgi:Domain of unknown function (DUF6249)
MSDNGIVLFLLVSIVAGVVLMIAAMNNRRKMREMEHRERLAMIERGAVPPPETNPAAFEAAVGLDDSKDGDNSHRYRTAGVLMVGLGFGLMFVIGVAGGAPEAGFGIGAAWVSLGGASLLNYWLMSRRSERERRARWSSPVRRPDPPNIAT